MKRTLSILLILLLALSVLPAAAFADGPAVVLSPQKLRVDGRQVACEKYNIDGSNYFKLRDIAMVLSSTGSEFSVGWDAEKNVISVVTGEEYEPNGSELDLSGGDKSASAAPSTQTLLINGVERGDLSAYNIGGNNFFKLRDLGDALGFQVNFDRESNTAVVVSRVLTWPTEWLTEETIYNENGAAISHSVMTYSEDGQLLTSLWEDQYGWEKEAYTYDSLGRTESYTDDSSYTFGEQTYDSHRVITYEYNVWGLLSRKVFRESEDLTYVTVYTYDDNGRILSEETITPDSSYVYLSEYDDNGNLIRYTSMYGDEVTYSRVYTLDEQGRVIVARQLNGDGEVESTDEYVYDAAGNMIEDTFTGSGAYSSVIRFAYDERGNEIHSESVSPYETSVVDRVFDGNDNLVREEVSYGDYSSVYVREYDGRGLLVRVEFSTSRDEHYVEEYTYDGEGRTLTFTHRSEGYLCTENYTYDLEAGKKTCLVVTEHEGMG